MLTNGRRAHAAPGRIGAWQFPDVLLVALFALIASIGGVLNDFVYDDIPLIRDNDRLHTFASWPAIWSHPYWPPAFVEQLYRPLTLQVLAWQHVIGHGNPIVCRLTSYVLYAGCCIGVYSLATRFLSRRVALAVAILFSVHPVHVEAVALAVGQAELLVGIAAILMVSAYMSAREKGPLTRRDWLTCAGLFLLAALCKETGFVLPALLLAAEVLLCQRRTPLRWRELAWGSALLSGVAAMLVVARHTVLPGGAFSVVSNRSLEGLGFEERMQAMLAIVPLWWQRFLWPAHLQVDYVPVRVAPHALSSTEGLGLLLLVGVAAAGFFSYRRLPVLCFGIVWCGIGLLPVSNLIPTGVMLAERTLFLPSIGVVLGVGALAEWALGKWSTPLLWRVARGFLIIAVALGLVRSVSRHSVWNSRHFRIVPSPERR